MCLWSPLRAAGLLRLCVARPFRLPVSLLAGLVTLKFRRLGGTYGLNIRMSINVLV